MLDNSTAAGLVRLVPERIVNKVEFLADSNSKNESSQGSATKGMQSRRKSTKPKYKPPTSGKIILDKNAFQSKAHLSLLIESQTITI